MSRALESKEGENFEMCNTQQPTCSFSMRGSTHQEDDDTVLDTEEDDQLNGGLSMFDKGIMGAIWGVAFIYGVLTEQVLSKKIDVPCSVSDHISENFGIASIILAIIIPSFIGPIMVTIIHIIISIINVVMKNAPVAADLKSEELGNILCTVFLTFVFLFTYIISMIICEVFLPADDNILYFVIIKYIAGTSHHLLGPISILLSRQDICHSVIFVYRRGGTTQSKSFEITAEQIQKELGLGVNP